MLEDSYIPFFYDPTGIRGQMSVTSKRAFYLPLRVNYFIIINNQFKNFRFVAVYVYLLE